MAKQEIDIERAVLFWVFITFFVVIASASVLVIFFGIGHVKDYERKILFSVFIIEIGYTMLMLFKLNFFKKKSPFPVRLHLTDEKNKPLIYEMKYDKQKVKCELRDHLNETIDIKGRKARSGSSIEYEMQYIGGMDGLRIKVPEFPSETERVIVTINSENNDEGFGGSYELNTYSATLRRGAG